MLVYFLNAWIEGIDAVVGIRNDRCLMDNSKLCDLKKQGLKVHLRDLVWVVWFWVKQKKKKLRYFLISLSQANAKTIKCWRSFRWRIKAFLKTIKQPFGFSRFAQKTKQGVFRYLIPFLFTYAFTSPRNKC